MEGTHSRGEGLGAVCPPGAWIVGSHAPLPLWPLFSWNNKKRGRTGVSDQEIILTLCVYIET